MKKAIWESAGILFVVWLMVSSAIVIDGLLRMFIEWLKGVWA